MVIPHGMWDIISQPGIELMPLYWKGRILITGPQGKSLDYLDSLIYLIIQLLSHVWLFVTPWTIAYQDSPSMEFSRQEYWSGLPFPSPEYLVKPVNPTGNQSWIFIGRNAEAEAPIFGHLIWRVDSLEKILTLGKTEVRRRRVWQRIMVEWHHWTWVWASSGRWWRTGKSGVLQSMGFQRIKHDWVPEQQPHLLPTFYPLRFATGHQ